LDEEALPAPGCSRCSGARTVDPDLHGRGIGSDALQTLVEHLLTDRDHHRVTIDPAADNAAAVRCYDRAGFRSVGVMESSWLDPHRTSGATGS
jgi:aminoglycoside 6'-N-acetyltransferase